MPEIGYSFAPGATSRPNQAGGGSGNGYGISPQEAVRILSLRVPDRPSPTAIAPLPLLQSPGGAAAGASGLQSMIAALMQAFRPTPPIPRTPGDRVELPFGGPSDRMTPSIPGGPGTEVPLQQAGPPTPRIIPRDAEPPAVANELPFTSNPQPQNAGLWEEASYSPMDIQPLF
jgi:hypothetical protein